MANWRKNLRWKMAVNKVTQADIANYLGISQPAVAKSLAANSNVSSAKKDELLSAYAAIMEGRNANQQV